MFFSVKPLLKEQAPKYDAGFIILKEIFLFHSEKLYLIMRTRSFFFKLNFYMQIKWDDVTSFFAL
jgi:hypothetical protein